jgi:hypothetical protein
MKFSKTYKLREITTTGELHLKVPTEFVYNRLGVDHIGDDLFSYVASDGGLVISNQKLDIIELGEVNHSFTGDKCKLRKRGNTYFIRIPYIFKSFNLACGGNLDSIAIEMSDEGDCFLYYRPQIEAKSR